MTLAAFIHHLSANDVPVYWSWITALMMSQGQQGQGGVAPQLPPPATSAGSPPPAPGVSGSGNPTPGGGVQLDSEGQPIPGAGGGSFLRPDDGPKGGGTPGGGTFGTPPAEGGGTPSSQPGTMLGEMNNVIGGTAPGVPANPPLFTGGNLTDLASSRVLPDGFFGGTGVPPVPSGAGGGTLEDMLRQSSAAPEVPPAAAGTTLPGSVPSLPGSIAGAPGTFGESNITGQMALPPMTTALDKLVQGGLG